MRERAALAKLLGACLGCALAVVAFSAAAAKPPALPPAAVTVTVPLGDDVFRGEVASAKSAMLADPQRALAVARSILRKIPVTPVSAEQRLEQATGQWLAGEALNRLNQPEHSAAMIATALATVERDAPGSKLRGDLLMSRAQIAVSTGQAQSALVNFQNAYKIFQILGEKRSEAVALQNIGSIYSLAGDQQRVLRYYQQSAETYSDDAALALSAHNNIGMAFRQLGRFDRAEAEYRQALALARAKHSPTLEARVLSNLASAQLLAGSLGSAEASANIGLKVAASEEAREWLPFLWGVKAQIAARRGDLTAAANLLDKTFEGQDPAKTGPVYRDFHDTAQLVYSKLGDKDRALAHLRAVMRIDDETREVRASTNAALMAAQFDFSNQELKISRLKTGQLERDVLLARSSARLRTIVLSLLTLLLGLTLAGYFSIRRSRNEVRKANDELSGSNRSLEKALKAKSEFLATTSHEIRTPLNGILGMTQVLLRDDRLTSDARDRVRVVQGAGEMMKAVVDDILDMARIESGRIEIEREELDLTALLRDVGGLWVDQAAAKGVRVTLDLDSAPGRIIEDGRRLRQIVFNLMSNAVKFTEAGSVTLTAKAMQGDGDDELWIAVHDTGIGIAADQLGSIFEPFKQVDGGTSRKYSGTGLGLAISGKLVEAMGGRLGVESSPGRGSIFTVRLPLQVREIIQTNICRATGRPTLLSESRVLIVEPNPLLQSIVRAALEGEVESLDLVADLTSALEAIATSMFDVIAIDACAAGPSLLDDVTALRAAAAGHAALVLLSGDPAALDQPALLEAGIARIALKSFPPMKLAADLAGALASEAAESALAA